MSLTISDTAWRAALRLRVRINKRELLGAGLLCLLALASVLKVSASATGKIAGMGSGVLPVLLGSLLLVAGITWLFNSRLSPDEVDDAEIGSSKWRGICGAATGLFCFLIAGKYFGLGVAVFALVFLTVLGDHRHTPGSAALLAGCATLLAVPLMPHLRHFFLFA